MFRKILVSLFIVVFGFLNSQAVYAGLADNEGSSGNNFSASTLSFGLADSSDEPWLVPLFYSSDLVPDATRSAFLRISKEGIEDFKYNVYFTKNGGDEILCDALRIEAKLGGESVYEGDLVSLWAAPTPTITEGEDDWEFILSLSDSSPELMNKTCLFDLTFKGWQTDSNGGWGFTHYEFLSSTISTVAWEVSALGIQSVGESLEVEEPAPSAQLDPIIQESLPSEETGEVILTPTVTPTPTIQSEDPVSPTPAPQETDTEETQENSGEQEDKPVAVENTQ